MITMQRYSFPAFGFKYDYIPILEDKFISTSLGSIYAYERMYARASTCDYYLRQYLGTGYYQMVLTRTPGWRLAYGRFKRCRIAPIAKTFPTNLSLGTSIARETGCGISSDTLLAIIFLSILIRCISLSWGTVQMFWKWLFLTRAPLAVWIFHGMLGGGSVWITLC